MTVSVYEALFAAPLTPVQRDVIVLLLSAEGLKSDVLARHMYGADDDRARNRVRVAVDAARRSMLGTGWTIRSKLGGRSNPTFYSVERDERHLARP